MAKMSGKTDSSELLAVAEIRDENTDPFFAQSNPVFVLFDRPSNKGNLGTLMRSCDSMGVHGLIITGHAVDIYDPEVIVSSMGSFFCVPFVRLDQNAEIDAFINTLKSGFPSLKTVGTTSHHKTDLAELDLTTPVLFLIGNEADGLNHHLADTCDLLATIPMSPQSSASSLNVSCAATVMMYELNRQRSCKSSF
jgi:TrmH family RNA methyltransferase